jgi:hypothetical protein
VAPAGHLLRFIGPSRSPPQSRKCEHDDDTALPGVGGCQVGQGPEPWSNPPLCQLVFHCAGSRSRLPSLVLKAIWIGQGPKDLARFFEELEYTGFAIPRLRRRYGGFETFSCGPKKRPSPLATALVLAALRRLYDLALSAATVDVAALASSKGGRGAAPAAHRRDCSSLDVRTTKINILKAAGWPRWCRTRQARC